MRAALARLVEALNQDERSPWPIENQVAAIYSGTGGFLDRMYTNVMSSLRPGSIRYGLLCGVDGMVMDDGVTARLGERHYLMSTTSGGASLSLAIPTSAPSVISRR